MPVIFDRLWAKQWLDPNFGPNEATLATVLAPYPSALMEAHDVSSMETNLSMTGLTALTRLWSDSSGLFREAGNGIHIALQCIWGIQNDLDNISRQLLAANHTLA
jgi:hypothetical protein